MILLKVLNKGLISPYQDFQMELGKQYICRDFDENPAHDCSTGFYATEVEGLPYSFNISREVWECEVGGKSVEIDQFKRRYEKIKLVRKLEYGEVKRRALEAEDKVGYKLSEVLFPFNPLLIEHAEIDVQLLTIWDSVRTPVRDSVWDSVADSVGAPVRDSVMYSVWDSVRASVWDLVMYSVADSVGASVWDLVWALVRDSVRESVAAYIGSLFPNIEKWHHVNHKIGEYPFQSAVKLWNEGLVPSFDGEIWRLHAGEKAKVVCTQEANDESNTEG